MRDTLSLKRTGLVTITLLATGLLSTTASATMIPSGVANIGGSVDIFGGTDVNAGVYFYNTANTVANVFDAGTGIGSFSGLSGGTIQSLVGNPVTGPASIVDFATFTTTLGTINFNLTNINPGIGTAGMCLSNTVGNECTPTGSPFTLTQTQTGVTVTLSLLGIAYTGTSGSGSDPATGLFNSSVTVDGGTITGILNAVASPGGLAGANAPTYSATFTATPSPEPGPFALAIVGLGLLRLGSKRKWISRS
jgi:hypothetical protein